MGSELPPGAHALAPPTTITPSRTTISVQLKAEMLMWYDWCRAHDLYPRGGPIDDWVNECIAVLFEECFGLVHLVAPKEVLIGYDS